MKSADTTAKWLWWTYLFVAPVLGILLLTAGGWALPVTLVLTWALVFATARLRRHLWRTQRLVTLVFVVFTVSAIVMAFADPAQPSAMHIPSWVPALLGFYFVAAPMFMAGIVLVELHRGSMP